MPSAEIITIGTEILLGEILDTNARFIARKLRDVGIDLYRKTTVGDNTKRIAQVIQQALRRCDIIITTGGLGPTVDDPTREAIAKALGLKLEFHAELWEQIQDRFRRYNRSPTENNRRQAFVPQGALIIENPVGTAPAFIVEHKGHTIVALPGVPREMEYLLENTVIPYLRKRYDLEDIIKARVLHSAGIGESMIDDMIGDLETLKNPTVGLAAHSGQVDIRITVKASSEAQADELIKQVELEIRRRLGEWIYGVDEETLEEAALQALQQRNWRLAVLELGVGGELIRRLALATQKHYSGKERLFQGGEVITQLPQAEELMKLATTFRKKQRVDVCLAVAIYPELEQHKVYLALITPEGQRQFSRPYGGPPEYVSRWVLHHSLDILRKLEVIE